MSTLPPLPLANLAALETREVWLALTEAHRYLAELKGLCESLPNRAILLDTLGIQEAKDSSEIENIITTHDELYAYQEDSGATAAAKEVRHYVSALRLGYEAVRDSGLIRLETVLAVQSELELNRAGLRKLPGTVLKNEATGQTIYEPPQDAAEVESLMANLIDFIHANDGLDRFPHTQGHPGFQSFCPAGGGQLWIHLRRNKKLPQPSTAWISRVVGQPRLPRGLFSNHHSLRPLALEGGYPGF
jgi:hypothetical protein